MKHFSVQQKKRKRRAGRVRRVLGALLLALCLAAPQTARAADTQTVHDSTGKAMFDITFLAQGENMDPDPDSEQILSTRDLNDLERQAVIQAGTVWADILGDYGSNTSAVSVIVGTEEIYNAAASPLGGLIGDEFSSNIAWSEIAEGEETDAVGGVVFIGNGMAENSTWELAEHYFPVPITEGSDLATALVHEFGHLLGIGAGTVSADGLTGFALTESEGWTAWTGHLYDRFGTQATPGMTIVRYEGEEQTYESSVFVSGDLVESGVTFRGSNVSEVLQGALGGGLPVNGFEASASGGYRAELSHIELAHGLMSHQDWSNYTSFMEAELAVLQDLGYKIDRKNWFGYSVYNDGLTLTSTNGYWARTADGTAWIEGQANTATLGVGLHIYGSDNTITQAADLLACGTAGTGIRVDGSGNTVTVAEGTTVAADGAWGTGLLVSYGKNQTIVNQGSISALGSGGVAVRFDMGGNNNGDRTQYRGSWLLGAYEGEEGSGTWTKTALDEYVDSETGLLYDSDGVLLNLDGALVSDFDVSGTLAGSTAAVYIAPRAYAERINILNGASIAGDIVSDWDPTNELIQYADLNEGHSNTELTTRLTFGLAADENGRATDAADAAFAMTYDGNITGAKSIQVEVAGGGLEYNGTASVLSVTIDEGASLSGTGLYTLSTISDEEQGVSVGGTFANNGTYSPGSGLAAGDGADAIASVSIAGDYEQGSTGTLVLSLDGSGAADTLTVTGSASLAGTVALAPVRDYYADGDIGLALSDLVQAAALTVSESLASDILAASPTLTMALTTESTTSDAAYTISMSRAADAYSQYAASGQQADLARSLDEVGQTDLTSATGDLADARNLLTVLDFSSADGTDLPGAYKELGPDAYTKAGQASLGLQRSLSAQIVNGRLLASASGSNAAPAQAMAAGDEQDSAGSTRVFATPMGGRNVSFSSGGSDTSYYGLLAGAETDISLGRDSLTLGVHAAFLHTEGSANDNDKSKGDNISLGLHGRWDPDLSLDGCAFGSISPYVFGLVRGGLETRHMEREVSFNGYNRKAESDWTAPTFSALLGTGLDFRPCESFVFGPVLWLDWTAMWRPSVEEDGGRAADLKLDAATYQSLRSSLGARMNVRLHDGPDAARLAGSLDLSLTAVWNHEFLYDNGATTARFAHFGSTSFTDRADVSDRDTFGGMLQLTGHLTEDVTLSLFGGLEQGPKTSDAHGGASLVWSF